MAVVIPALNAAGTIGTALASVAGQIHRPTEVVVVDDGSTDETAQVAQAWSGELPVTVLRQHQSGAGLARHRGIGAATSDLVALLDADDAWLPDHLSTMVDTWAGDPDHMVSTTALFWIPGERVWKGSPDPVPAPADQLQQILQANFASGSALFHRALYERAGGFRPDFAVGEDWDLWIRMVRAGGIVVRTNHPTFCYRLTAGSLTSGGRQYVGAELVLEAAVREANSDEERLWARAGLGGQGAVQRRARAGIALVDAFDAARAGRRSEARRHARLALAGARRVAFLGLVVLIWPEGAVRARDRFSRR